VQLHHQQRAEVVGRALPRMLESTAQVRPFGRQLGAVHIRVRAQLDGQSHIIADEVHSDRVPLAALLELPARVIVDERMQAPARRLFTVIQPVQQPSVSQACQDTGNLGKLQRGGRRVGEQGTERGDRWDGEVSARWEDAQPPEEGLLSRGQGIVTEIKGEPDAAGTICRGTELQGGEA